MRWQKNANISIYGEEGVGARFTRKLSQPYPTSTKPPTKPLASWFEHTVHTCKPVQLNTNFTNLFLKIHVIISFPFQIHSSASKTCNHKNSVTVSFIYPTDWPIRGLTTLFQPGRQQRWKWGYDHEVRMWKEGSKCILRYTSCPKNRLTEMVKCLTLILFTCVICNRWQHSGTLALVCLSCWYSRIYSICVWL